MGWAYRYAEDRSTLFVEMLEEHWRSRGLDAMPVADSVAHLERAFAGALGRGQLLVTPQTQWKAFRWIRNERLVFRNQVLIGDAAATKHFCRGFGTAAALADAAQLAEALTEESNVSDGLARYQASALEHMNELAQDSEERAKTLLKLFGLLASGDTAAIKAMVVREDL